MTTSFRLLVVVVLLVDVLPAATASQRVLLERGARADAVTCWQAFLQAQGLLDKAHASGSFDDATASATRAYQHSRHIDETGVVDPKTMESAEAAGLDEDCACLITSRAKFPDGEAINEDRELTFFRRQSECNMKALLAHPEGIAEQLKVPEILGILGPTFEKDAQGQVIASHFVVMTRGFDKIEGRVVWPLPSSLDIRVDGVRVARSRYTHYTSGSDLIEVVVPTSDISEWKGRKLSASIRSEFIDAADEALKARWSAIQAKAPTAASKLGPDFLAKLRAQLQEVHADVRIGGFTDVKVQLNILDSTTVRDL